MEKLEKLRLRKSIGKYFKNGQIFDENFIYDMAELIIKNRKYKSMINNINVLDKVLKKECVVHIHLSKRI